MAFQLNRSGFENLLQDEVFIDYLNKFMALPVFGQRMIYRKKQNIFLFDPPISHSVSNNDIIDWIWEKRIPFFFRSAIYAEYKCARALIEYNLVEDGGVEKHVAQGLEYLQYHCFSKMSRFSKFCKFLSETGEGLKLVAFFVAAQHLIIAYYEEDPDFSIYMGQLRDRFFDETSCWCLPAKILKFTEEQLLQPNSTDYCVAVSKRVLSRMCLYWLPRYLLHLRMKDLSKDPDFADQRFHSEMKKVSDHILHGQIFKTSSTDALPTTGLSDMNITKMLSLDRNLANDKTELVDPFAKIDEEDSEDSDVLAGLNKKVVIQKCRDMARNRLNERRTTLRSAVAPGMNVSVDRPKSKKVAMTSLVQTMSRTQTYRGKRSNVTSAANSSTNLMQRTVNAKKQLSALKLQIDKEKSKKKGIDAIPEIDEKAESKDAPKKKGKKFAPKVKKSGRPQSNRRDKYPQIYGKKSPIPEEKEINSKGVFTMASFLSDADDVSGNSSGNVSSNDDSKNKPREPEKQKSRETKIEETKIEKSPIPNPRESKSPGLVSIFSARKTAMAWRTKIDERFDAETQSYETAKPQDRVSAISTFNMATFSMNKESNIMSDASENGKTITLDGSLPEEDESTSSLDRDSVHKAARYYLKERRNALGKVKPLKTLKDKKKNNRSSTVRSESRIDNDKVNQMIRDHNERLVKKKQKAKREADDVKKKDGIKKLLLFKNFHEKLSATVIKKEDRGDFIFTLGDDYEFRHVHRHLKAALRSDDFAAGPFLSYLTEDQEDEDGMFALCYWQECEKFRESFSGMQQNAQQDAIEEIITKFVLNEQGFAKVPGMHEYGLEVLDIDILESVSFPWQLRIIQKRAMETLNEKWKEFIQTDTNSLYEKMGILLEEDKHEAIEKSIYEVWADESKPVWIPPSETSRPSTSPATFFQNRESLSRQESGEKRTSRNSRRESRRGSGTVSRTGVIDSGVITRRESRLGSRQSGRQSGRQSVINRDSMTSTRRVTISSRTTIVRPAVGVGVSGLSKDPNRFTLGFNRESEIVSPSNGCMKSRDELLKVAMSRRTKRAYQLAEQTCRLTALQPQSANFISDESDDEGFVRPKPKPIYFRHTVKPNFKELSTLSSQEYPGSGVKTFSILQAPKKRSYTLATAGIGEEKKVHKYMKQKIIKNGVTLKRPNIRPKHLIDCLRDTVHYEFLHRFAKHFHFEKLVRFWKAVQNIKDETVSNRASKIMNVAVKFFSKGAATGIGFDSQLLREIGSLSPDKVTIQLLISAQATVLKVLEDNWGETYLSTFPEKKCLDVAQREGGGGEMVFDRYLKGKTGKMANAWRGFYAFIKRSAKFLRCMKQPEIRLEFERYLQTIGRDPNVYDVEGWEEVPGKEIDDNVNDDSVYHQTDMNGKLLTAEFLIYDFRFWYDVECYRKHAEAVHKIRNKKKKADKYDREQEANLLRKAEQICDHFLKSSILPQCRINVQPEICATILENVKLGMIDVSLFHDCIISIFPALIIYWKKFCFKRHEYVPRSDIRKLKNELIVTRRENYNKTKHKSQMRNRKASKENSIEKFPTDDLLDNPQTGKKSWADISKAFDNKQTISFSLCNGLRLAIPTNSSAKLV